MDKDKLHIRFEELSEGGEENQKELQELVDSDPEIKREYEKFKKLNELIFKYHKYEDEKKLISEAFEKVKEKNRYKQNQRYSFYKAAAVIIILLLPINYYLFLMPSVNESLFQQNFEPLITETFARDLTIRNAQLVSAIENYKAENYKIAIPIFEDHVSENPADVEIQLYLGICYLGIDNIDNAKKTLITIANQNNDFSSTANWYLGLTYLKNDEPDVAKRIFNDLIFEDTKFSERAKNILADL
ncbi:MAG: hypothetical protein SCALA702_28220 [Melioribacteraceae bacterium]|nr:MAG: hypothetical protein SCALA702_28220 [Melioribacteraceae bacterium]